MRQYRSPRRAQQGITLVLSLIMLILLTIMALSSFNIGKGSLQVIDNAQQQTQALNAAQGVIDQVVSTPGFVDNPSAVLSNSNCPTGISAPANSTCVDLNGDGKTVLVVKMSPQPACTQVKAISTDQLDVTVAEDLGCTKSPDPGTFGIAGATSGASLCSDSVWEINAEASDSVSNAKAVVTQGVAMRVSNDAVGTACP